MEELGFKTGQFDSRIQILNHWLQGFSLLSHSLSFQAPGSSLSVRSLGDMVTISFTGSSSIRYARTGISISLVSKVLIYKNNRYSRVLTQFLDSKLDNMAFWTSLVVIVTLMTPQLSLHESEFQTPEKMRHISPSFLQHTCDVVYWVNFTLSCYRNGL